MSKTYMAKPGDIAAAWHVVDAENQILGRMASRIAMILQGKHRPTYTPHVDTGDFVVVVNADKVLVTGRKLDSKLYYRRTNYIGSLKSTPMREVMAQKPEFVVTEAVRRMLPRSKLGRKMLTKLKVYAGATHPHEAQNPQPVEL